MLNTSALRRAWAPACSGKGGRYLAAYAALDACLRVWRYAPRRGDTGAYNCRRITGGTGYSLHAYGPGDSFTFWNGVRIATSLAVDINWQTNPYSPRLITDMPRAMTDAIKRIRTNSGRQVWGWGGDYRTNKDAMHFEVVCSPADLSTGIDPRSLPGGVLPQRPNPEEFTVDAEARARFDRIDREVAAIKRGLIVDEASDATSHLQLRAWIVAIARKLNVKREDAIAVQEGR